MTTPDGRVWDERGEPVFDSEGNLLGVVEIAQDITDRKRLESQLRQAQKMEAIGQLAGGVSHDFNNILTAILGNAELMRAELETELAGSDPLLTDLSQIERSANRAAALTRQLLMFSRRHIITPEILDPNQVLADMQKMLGRLIREDITLDVLPGPNVACIHADPNQIEQVVMNLVVNARDAMPGGGTLTIETANVTLDEEDTADHPDVRPGPYVMFAISDTGCGIDKQTVQRIFEPFFTTKADGQGTGLGLATVHGIVKQTGGHVMVDSEPDRGTTFKVYFPAVDETASAKSRPHPADQTLDGNETVLICEDDDVVRDMVRHALESHGYTVLTAESAPHALKLAAAHSGPIHLLVTDVVMPEMNGRALAEALAVTRPEIKVLYVSGYTSDVIGHHGVLDEGVAFLQKPFNTSILLSCISSVLGRIGSEHHDS